MDFAYNLDETSSRVLVLVIGIGIIYFGKFLKNMVDSFKKKR